MVFETTWCQERNGKAQICQLEQRMLGFEPRFTDLVAGRTKSRRPRSAVEGGVGRSLRGESVRHTIAVFVSKDILEWDIGNGNIVDGSIVEGPRVVGILKTWKCCHHESSQMLRPLAELLVSLT